MKKLSFRIVLFVSIISITIIACSKKSSTTPQISLPQTVTIRPIVAGTILTDTGFIFNTPNGFTFTSLTGSVTANGFKGNLYNNISGADTVVISCQFGNQAWMNYVDSANETEANIKSSYTLKSSTVSKVSFPTINGNKAVIVYYTVDYVDANTSSRIDLFVFNPSYKAPRATIRCDYKALSSKEKSIVEAIYNTFRFTTN